MNKLKVLATEMYDTAMVYSLFLNSPIAVEQGTPIFLSLFYEALDTRYS